MRNIVDPRQGRLFDPFQGLFSPIAIRILSQGWQGVFRHVILKLLPVAKLAEHFHPTLGAPTKELYSMAGLVFLADFHNWTSHEAAEAYIFRTDVQYALNLEPGAEVSDRSIERYQKLYREDDAAARIFGDVTAALTEKLELDVSRQRLDSTHLFSHMATFGRTKLMAVAIKRFLTQVHRHAPEQYASLPEDLRCRYQPAESQLFAGAKDAEARQRSRQQAAEDLLLIIDHFADQPAMTARSTYKSLETIFGQQCEVVEGKVTVRAKTGGNCIQNPSDLDATYDGHKGPGYQVQITETCRPENEVQLITAALPQTACESDEAALVPILEQLEEAGRLPEDLLVDTSFASDDNVQAAAERGVELIGPVPGRAPEDDLGALTVDDFAMDERTGVIDACPAGHQPLSCTRDEEGGKTKVEMPAEACGGCPFRSQCPIVKTREGRFVVEFTDKEHRLAGRRVEQETEVFKGRYAVRSGIESTNSGLKNRLDLGRLRVRGRGAVFRVIHHKLAGWNVLRAAVSTKLRAWVAEWVARALNISEFAPSGNALVPSCGSESIEITSFCSRGCKTDRRRLSFAA
jgi:DDE family transposase